MLQQAQEVGDIGSPFFPTEDHVADDDQASSADTLDSASVASEEGTIIVALQQ